jgi:hypothetical protein
VKINDSLLIQSSLLVPAPAVMQSEPIIWVGRHIHRIAERYPGQGHGKVVTWGYDLRCRGKWMMCPAWLRVAGGARAE